MGFFMLRFMLHSHPSALVWFTNSLILASITANKHLVKQVESCFTAVCLRPSRIEAQRPVSGTVPDLHEPSVPSQDELHSYKGEKFYQVLSLFGSDRLSVDIVEQERLSSSPCDVKSYHGSMGNSDILPNIFSAKIVGLSYQLRLRLKYRGFGLVYPSPNHQFLFQQL